MVDKTAPSLVRKDIHDVERVVQRYKRKPLDQAYLPDLGGIHTVMQSQMPSTITV